MISRQIPSLFEGNAVEFLRRVENTFFQNRCHFEIRFDLVFIQIIFRFSHLLRIEIPVPRFNFEVSFLCIYHFLNFFCFAVCGFHCWFCQLSQKSHCRFRRFCHLVLQAPFSEVFHSEKLGFLQSQFCQFLNRFSCVICITFLGASPRCFEEFFSCCSVFQVLQHWLLCGVLQSQKIFSFLSGLFCVRCSSGNFVS
ncbi:hypothetical protein D3C86_1286180 [compost metagenome]